MLNNLNVKEQDTFFLSFCLCYRWASGRGPQVRKMKRDKKKKRDQTRSMQVKDEKPKERKSLMALHPVNSEPAT